jgi:hypothetical protein
MPKSGNPQPPDDWGICSELIDGVLFEAILPPELSRYLGCDDTPPLPVPDRPVSLAERFAVLGVVHDAHWKGDDKIGLWPNVVQKTDDVWPECAASFYSLLLNEVVPEASEQQNAPIVGTWLDDVSMDLSACVDVVPAAVSADEIARVFELAGDETSLRVYSVARDASRSANDRMYAIMEIDRRCDGYDSNRWGELLGVNPAAIRQTEFWKSRQKRREML